MEIRKYRKNDQKTVKDFILKVLSEFGFSHNSEFDYDLEDPDKYDKNIGGVFYVFEDKGKIIGTIAVKNKGENIAEIRRLYNDSKFRGKGYGSKLFDAALEFCKENNYKKVVLDTWSRFEKAKLLYLSRGFTITKTSGEQIFMEKTY